MAMTGPFRIEALLAEIVIVANSALKMRPTEGDLSHNFRERRADHASEETHDPLVFNLNLPRTRGLKIAI